MSEMQQLQYPIGQFEAPEKVDREQINAWIDEIESLPARVREAVADLTDEQLDTYYRPGGWTLRQVVHHIVDSHINSYVRFKWTLTEEKPLIKAYNEALWCWLPDAKEAPLDHSLNLLDALHVRWVYMLRACTDKDYKRFLNHPETGGQIVLGPMVGMYAWHGNHHLAHITTTKEKHGW